METNIRRKEKRVLMISRRVGQRVSGFSLFFSWSLFKKERETKSGRKSNNLAVGFIFGFQNF